MVDSPTIILGVITCKRPRLLTELLESIVVQTIFFSRLKVETVIVDNDEQQSALQVYNNFAADFPGRLEYFHETRRGIPYARNRVLEFAVERNSEYIAFIDDDETAAPDWLEALYTTITTNNVDGVQGRVVSLLPENNIPRWAAAAKRKTCNKKEGQARTAMSTNNVIFRTACVVEPGLCFDVRFALSGGSDIDFFKRSAEAGSKHIWTNRATVYERIPHSRLTTRWQFQRLFRVGAATTHMSVRKNGLVYTMIRYCPKIISRLFLGPILLVSVGVVWPKAFLTSIQWIGSAIGLIAGFWGVLGREYSTIHGN